MKKLSTINLALFSIFQAFLCGCHDVASKDWVKPHRMVGIPADVRKALILANSSSVLSKYGPLAGVLNELLPEDIKDLTVDPVEIDWSRERCIWTFDTKVDEIQIFGSALIVHSTREEGAGLQLWFFAKQGPGNITQIKFD